MGILDSITSLFGSSAPPAPQAGGGKKKKKNLPRIRNRLHKGPLGGVFEIKHHKKVYECKPKSKKSKK